MFTAHLGHFLHVIQRRRRRNGRLHGHVGQQLTPVHHQRIDGISQMSRFQCGFVVFIRLLWRLPFLLLHLLRVSSGFRWHRLLTRRLIISLLGLLRVLLRLFWRFPDVFRILENGFWSGDGLFLGDIVTTVQFWRILRAVRRHFLKIREIPSRRSSCIGSSPSPYIFENLKNWEIEKKILIRNFQFCRKINIELRKKIENWKTTGEKLEKLKKNLMNTRKVEIYATYHQFQAHRVHIEISVHEKIYQISIVFMLFLFQAIQKLLPILSLLFNTWRRRRWWFRRRRSQNWSFNGFRCSRRLFRIHRFWSFRGFWVPKALLDGSLQLILFRFLVILTVRLHWHGHSDGEILVFLGVSLNGKLLKMILSKKTSLHCCLPAVFPQN